MASKILLVLVFLYVVFSKPVLAATIVLEPNTKYQTIVGWEAVSQAGQWDFSTQFSAYKNTLFDQAVNDLGINRLRVEIFAKNMNGSIVFDLASLDKEFDAVVIPMKQRLEARGEKLFINVCFVGSNNNSTFNTNPSGYADQVLLTYQHLQSKYGFIPDGWEVILEPGWVALPKWTGEQIGNALIAAGDLLKANNFPTYFIAPSGHAGPDMSLGYFNSMIASMIAMAPSSTEYIKEFSYHRYSGASPATLNTVASLRTTYNINTAMLEHGGADYNELHDDLKYANVSAWEQYTLAFPTSDNGYQYYPISGSTIIMGSRTKFLRQYFKYVRAGAVRIKTSGTADSLAFKNKDDRYVVIARGSGSFTVSNLPAGTYGIFYTTGSVYNFNLTDITLAAGQDLNAEIDSQHGAGVITIYAKTVGSTPVAGDLNSDGKVDISDLRLAIKNFSSVFDITNVLANYGQPSP